LVLVANVALSIVYMVIYGHLIDPGHEESYYQDHIQVAAPYCSILAGMPLMFLAGWWVAGWWQCEGGLRAGFIVWLVYFLIDLAVVLAAGITPQVAGLVFVSFLTKLLAVWIGGRVRKQRRI
jgi:hypothetical protein